MKEVGEKRFSPGRIFMYSFLTIITLISVFPFYWMFVIGSNTTAAIYQFPPAFLPGDHFFVNVAQVFDRVDFFRALLNSFIVSTTTTVIVLFLCSLAGFAFAKLKFKGCDILFVFVMATMMVPIQLGLIPQYMIINQLNWLNTLQAVIVPGIINAFGVFWMRQYIVATIPDELLEAGRMDGCSNFRLYWNLVIPSIRPALATLGMIVFMYHWNDFLWPLVVLRDSNVHTIQIALRALNDSYSQDYSMIFAGTFLATIPILIVFLIFSKQFISGLMDGSIKS